MKGAKETISLAQAKNAVKGAKGQLAVTSKFKGVVTVPNCMLKGSWEEEGSGGIRKKLKYEVQLICNVKIVEMIVSSI